MKSLIGVAGHKRSGKDTLADLLVAEYGYHKASFAGPLKEMALAVDPVVHWWAEWDPNEESTAHVDRLSNIVAEIGWEMAKDEFPEVRRFLQRLGSEGVRGTFGPNAWVDLALPHAVTERTVFTDVRFPSEADRILECGGQLLRLVRPSTRTGDVHQSETALDDYPMPVVVNEGSLRELRCRAVRALS